MNICIVTDIHGQPEQETCLLGGLQNGSRVRRFSLSGLCGKPDLTGDALHDHLFKNDGMDDVVQALKRHLTGGTIGLGYSAGGTAIWRAAATGLSFASIVCVSSTRLREEASIPTPNHVFFGADDQGKPSLRWLSTVPDAFTIFDNVGHNYYLDPTSEAAKATCDKILESLRR